MAAGASGGGQDFAGIVEPIPKEAPVTTATREAMRKEVLI